MHPNRLFRTEDRDLLESLIEEIGFGMVFAQTPDGPRVAHVPLVSTGDGAVQFHLARANALTRHLAGTNALAMTQNTRLKRIAPTRRWGDVRVRNT